MDLIETYELDALPAIDKEYDHPYYNSLVKQLIDEEMKTFTPKDYLAELPSLWPEEKIASCVEKIEKLGEVTNPKLDLVTYSSEPIDLGNSLQSWKANVNHIKVQYCHQENHLLNLEVAEKFCAKGYLDYNKALETINGIYSSEIQQTSKATHEIQKSRQQMQEKAYPQLSRHTNRFNEALQRRFLCDVAYNQLNEQLKNKGFDYEEFLIQEAEKERIRANPHDPSYNSTVRQYETIRTTEVEGDELNNGKHRQVFDNLESNPSKKPRI